MVQGTRISYTIDTCLNLLKSPVAVVFAAATIPSIFSLLHLVSSLNADHPGIMIEVVGGLCGYCFLGRIVLKRTNISFLSTLEHEITHAIFALLTLHPVTGIRSSLRGGGEMTIHGKGNWLITVSPYFFPTATFVLCLLLSVFPIDFSQNAATLFGISLGYHAIWNSC